MMRPLALFAVLLLGLNIPLFSSVESSKAATAVFVVA